ncbi:LacI family DNA-binding transcriptional regulator [Nonomuraea angiospora]|uniref:LacI family DNA-binding transcriptional regulator n=1 Tax=Nonomuraea angiospora TaxID=46172 RepID=UPI003422ABD3
MTTSAEDHRAPHLPVAELPREERMVKRSPPRRSPVMADVAEAAGVSHQTVSRVLNGHPHVGVKTRARVLEAIEQLGYRRNMAARALVTRRSRTLGVVGFDTTLHGPASMVYGVEQAARAAGYFVSIVSLKTSAPEETQEALAYLAGQGVDGIMLVAPPRPAILALEGLPRGLPMVVMEGGAAERNSTVSVDQGTGARMITEHLLALGHETVWHIGGPADVPAAESRAAGWRAALAASGREIPEPLVGDWSPRSGYEAGRRLLREPGVTAVFAANDQMALGLLRAVAEAGIRVPAQISVAGFDDLPESEFFSPPLTTVMQDFEAVGRQGIDLLLRLMETGRATVPEHLVIQPRLITRQSTAALAPCPTG